MKPLLQLNVTQNLTLTPQLQQAIRLLQLSTLDLQQEIQQILESNPMLEISPNDEREEMQSPKNSSEFNDYQWPQTYTTENKKNYNDSDYNNENLYCTTYSLQDHLRWQLDLAPMSDTDRIIATALIDAINEDGFLSLSITELYTCLNSEEFQVDMDEIEAVRHRLQHFDPVGCASTNLAETLLVQLNHISGLNSDINLAKQLVKNDLALLGQHNYRQLMKNYQVNEQSLNQALALIQGLNPRPGSTIQQNVTEYLTPDVVVRKIDGIWQVTLNHHTLPRLCINQQYASLIQRANNSPDNQFLRNSFQEARWFLKSIESRQETLLKVAHCIVAYQHDFLEYGDEAMKPLVLNHVATALEMHESTISRVTTQKYMHTPRGVFELKYFFSSHVNTINGGECSSTAIRAVIKKLISCENREKPLSDNKIAQLIAEQGIQVARRTVAKYREALCIAPSHERKIIRC